MESPTNEDPSIDTIISKKENPTQDKDKNSIAISYEPTNINTVTSELSSTIPSKQSILSIERSKEYINGAAIQTVHSMRYLLSTLPSIFLNRLSSASTTPTEVSTISSQSDEKISTSNSVDIFKQNLKKDQYTENLQNKLLSICGSIPQVCYRVNGMYYIQYFKSWIKWINKY